MESPIYKGPLRSGKTGLIVLHTQGPLWIPRQHFKNVYSRPSLHRKNSQFRAITSPSHRIWVSSHSNLLKIILPHANCLLSFPIWFLLPSPLHLGFFKKDVIESALWLISIIRIWVCTITFWWLSFQVKLMWCKWPSQTVSWMWLLDIMSLSSAPTPALWPPGTIFPSSGHSPIRRSHGQLL